MNVLWGSYQKFEGPWCRGVHPFVLSGSPTDNEKILAVITATEGGAYDAVNMYDMCLWTVGIIQWCNAAPQLSVDDMLGRAVEIDPFCIKPLAELALERAYTFKKVGGKYRFERGGNVVVTAEDQKSLYFLNSRGAKGTWDAASKQWARRWCEASARVWESSDARKAQLEYTAQRVQSFAYGAGRTLLSQMPNTNIGQAWRAMYLSFAANNPVKAAQAVAAVVDDRSSTPWTEAWLNEMAYSLVTRPGISIYPSRYNKIRPVIEWMYGINLPDYADELAAWSKHRFNGRWCEPIEIQRALLALGYDIGPSGADGVIGARTRAAIRLFEPTERVPIEHQDGFFDEHTAVAMERALERQGITALS